MANFTTSTPTTSDPSEIHGLLAVGTDNTGKLLDPDALANLAYTASPTQGTVTSDTGTDAIIPAADGTNAGLFLPAEKTKLAGIAEGAEVNVNADWNASSGDAQILNKPTIVTDHTGLSSIGTNTHAQIDTHIASTTNPHSVTKTQVGLGNVANADTTTTANITDSSNKRFITDAQQTVLNNTSGVNTGDQNLFQTIAVSGQNNVVADSTADTLTLAAGSNITITTDALTDTITIASGVANLAYTASPTQGTVTSDTGTDAIIPAADGTNAGLFLPAEKTKLAGIAEGAEVNVNADWNASSGDAQILNKPTLGTAAATNSTDYATAAQGAKADTAVQPAAIGSTVLAFDSNLQSFVNAFTLPTTDGTAGQSLVTNGAGVISFATPAILADPVYIGGVAYFNRSTKPTERSAGVALVAGDRWYKNDDGTSWFWNGTYWLGETQYARFPGLLKNTYTLTNGSTGLLDNGQVTVTGLTMKPSIFVDGFYFCLSGVHTGTLDANNKFSIRVRWRDLTTSPYVVDSLNKFNNTIVNGLQTRYVQLNSVITAGSVSGGVSYFGFVVSDVVGSPTLSTPSSWNQANVVYREIYP